MIRDELENLCTSSDVVFVPLRRRTDDFLYLFVFFHTSATRWFKVKTVKGTDVYSVVTPYNFTPS